MPTPITGNDTTPAKILCKSGLLGNFGGLGANKNIMNALLTLDNASIHGIMTRVMMYAAGAYGNRITADNLASVDVLQSLSANALTALSKVGNQLIPGLASVLPADATTIGNLDGIFVSSVSPIKNVLSDASSQFALAGGFKGTLNFAIHNMTGGDYNPLGSVPAGALKKNLPVLIPNKNRNIMKQTSIITIAVSLSDSNKNLVGAISEGVSLKFGAGTAGYGPKVRNMQDAMTFSITTLGQNIDAIAADLINVGNWDISDLMRLMPPGQVALQILKKGTPGLGLVEELIKMGVPVAGVDNPMYDNLTLKALSNINSAYAINYVKSVFGMRTEISNLGDICLLEKMMLTSKDYLPVANFRELGVQFSYIGINSSSLTMRDLGNIISQIETSTDLNHISQLETPVPNEVGSHLMQVYGFGGGQFGEQTLIDMIGTAAGYIHVDTIQVITAAANFISGHHEAARLVVLSNLLQNTLTGDYTDIGLIGDPLASPPVPHEPGLISIPFNEGLMNFNTLDDAVLYFIPLIEAEHRTLLNSTDPMLVGNIKKLDLSYKASCSQLVRENNNLIAHNINLFDIPTQVGTALSFTNKLESWATITGYGSPAEYLERIVTDDIYGNSIVYIMRQTRNADLLNTIGIDIDQFRLPRSQYYTDPDTFYNNLYTGNLPSTPENQATLNLPQTTTEVYASNRHNVLLRNGYDQVKLTDNEKTERYYDLLWNTSSNSGNESIGRNVVKQIITDRTFLIGNEICIVDISNSNIKFGLIVDGMLVTITDKEGFVTAMSDAVNQLLYGQIITTKTENPFKTDEMISGVLELLYETTRDTIFSLMETVTGKLLAIDLLDKIADKFNVKRSQLNTGMDRNDPTSWGDVGPGGIPIIN